MIVGLYTRFFALVLLVINTALVKSSGYYTYGVDYFISMSLVYIILYPSDSYYSLRSKFSRKLRKTNFLIVKRTMQFHLCFAYMISGLEKLSGYNWRNGESIWKAIHLPNFDNDFNVNVDFLGKYPIIFVVIGWLTIIIELLYPLFTSIKKTREMWLYLTIGLHLSIVLFLNLYFFSAIMIIWNITTFYSFDKK
ncbi:MAG: HTTM domain-containing protein [Bacteroidota bacterium]|nr:HTTM domain-containing protein [Bacteroidota bacterium]